MTVEIQGQKTAPLPKRDVFRAIMAGLRRRCPKCETGKMFYAYLKVNDTCPHCGEALHHHRADDAPPYFTITIVAHIVVPGLLFTERGLHLPLATQLAIWLPATLALCLGLLPPVKGALIGLQWANYMHGFHPHLADGDANFTWAPHDTPATNPE